MDMDVEDPGNWGGRRGRPREEKEGGRVGGKEEREGRREVRDRQRETVNTCTCTLYNVATVKSLGCGVIV